MGTSLTPEFWRLFWALLSAGVLIVVLATLVVDTAMTRLSRRCEARRRSTHAPHPTHHARLHRALLHH